MSYSQIASRIIVTQSAPRDTFPDNYTWIDNSTTPINQMNRWFVAKWDSVKIKPWNIKWLKDSMNIYYYPLNSNPAGYLTGITIGQVTGALGFVPYNSSNPSGYISGITGSNVTTALGYTPYNATNPNNYISSINSGMVTTALGFTPYNSTNPNGYISSYTETDPLFNSKFAGKTTTDLAEGTNLYYTAARFNSAFTSKTTSDLAEGTNLYFTNARARSALGSGTGISYNSSTGVITNSAPDQTVSMANGTGISVTGTYPNFTVTNTAIPSAPTFNNNVSRSLSNAAGSTNQYTISASQNARVTYTITLSCSTPLLAGTASAQVYLEYSTNAGSSWVTVADVANAQTVGLSVSVAISTPQNFVLSGEIPGGALCRLRTVTAGASPGTATYVRGQEVLF